MNFLIYLQIDDDKLYHKTMEPKDTLNYEFVLSDKIENDLPEGCDQSKLEALNKREAMICHSSLMRLRLKMKQYNAPGAKLLRLEKYYVDVLSAYLDFFEDKKVQFPQWRLDQDNIPRYAVNLLTGENVRLTKKQGKALSVFYKHFIDSNIGNEWLCFEDVYNMIDENDRNDDWFGMTDIFEKKEGKEKINKLFDVKPEGSKRYYRIKTGL